MWSRVTLLFRAVLLCWLLLFCFRTGRLIVNAYNPLPEMDYWETVPHLDGYRNFPPRVLWEQHYEHRVIFPELVFGFDWLFLKGREMLPLMLTAALDVAVWIILILAYRASGVSSVPAMWCGLLLAGIVLAWPGVAFVLAFPFSLQFLMYQFSITASLWALSKNRVSWAIALGVLASFSSANGLFVWPVLALLGWRLKLSNARLLAIASVGILSGCVFFVGYRNIGNMHPGLILSQTKTFLGYFLMYLGMPFGAVGTTVGLAAGTLSLFLLASLSVAEWHTKETSPPIVVVCFGVCLLTTATALITTASRLPMDARPFEQGIVIPGRYVNFAAHYWAVLSIWLVWKAGRIRSQFAWVGVVGLTLFFAATLFRTDLWVKVWMGFYGSYQYATLAIESGLTTEQMGKLLNYADGSLVTRSIRELERRHLSLYSWDRYKLVGRPLASMSARLSAELPEQQVSSVEPIDGGFRIVGWGRPKGAYVLVCDASETVIGLGRHLAAAETWGGIPIPEGHVDDYWVAFAPPGFHREQARFFVLSK